MSFFHRHHYSAHHKPGKPGKLGKADAVRPDLPDIDSYGTLNHTPSYAHYGYVAAKVLDLDGNDQYGDCVIASLANAVPVWNHIVSGSVASPVAIPTSAQAVTEYFTLEGSPNGVVNPSLDNGLSESTTLATARSGGLFGGSLVLPYYAPITPTKQQLVEQVIAYYGICYAGFQFPDSAMDQFNAGDPFTLVRGSKTDGGHAMFACGYTQDYVYLYTWQRIVAASWRWFLTYADEAYAIIPQSYVTANKVPSSVNLAALEADLNSL